MIYYYFTASKLPPAAESDRQEQIKKLQRAIYFAFFFMIVELIGGYITNSIAIMTDAAHMLSDVGEGKYVVSDK
jgi:Co/Zn/Cd efflux system component